MTRRVQHPKAVEEKSAPTFDDLPASKKVTLPELCIGTSGKPVTYHYFEGVLYINGRPTQRRRS